MQSNRTASLICALAALALVCLSVGCKKVAPSSAPPTRPLYHVVGTQIVDARQQPIRLQGIAFGNEVWSNREIPNTHHSEIDYSRVKDMGMNVVRFYMNYKTFEDDALPYQYKPSGWAWIDQNIAWAKNQGIYLILNMHVPPGGFQSQGNGDALWDVPENQHRLTALWKAIAKRYSAESQIIGYGLVNEPVPNHDISQWQQLAQRLTDSIRTVDTNHILFIERANWVKGKPETPNYNFPAISDQQVAYEFHFYDPFEYTHQLFSWASPADGGSYPNNSILSYSNATWYTATLNNPTLSTGNTNWQYVAGQRFTVTDPQIKLAVPALVAANVGGRVYFDSLEIQEFDPWGNLVQSILRMNLSSTDGWNYWSATNTGGFGLSSTTGSHDNNSLYIEHATGDCNISNYTKVFQPKFNHTYQINGWMKGEALAPNAACRIRIDFLKTNNPILGRNKQYLESLLRKYSDWGQSRNVPMYLGEFGAGAPCFQNNKGGLQWVSDMLDISIARNFYFTYHTYHEDHFGLYLGYGTLPDPSRANQTLIDLFRSRLRN